MPLAAILSYLLETITSNYESLEWRSSSPNMGEYWGITYSASSLFISGGPGGGQGVQTPQELRWGWHWPPPNHRKGALSCSRKWLLWPLQAAEATSQSYSAWFWSAAHPSKKGWAALWSFHSHFLEELDVLWRAANPCSKGWDRPSEPHKAVGGRGSTCWGQAVHWSHVPLLWETAYLVGTETRDSL